PADARKRGALRAIARNENEVQSDVRDRGASGGGRSNPRLSGYDERPEVERGDDSPERDAEYQDRHDGDRAAVRGSERKHDEIVGEERDAERELEENRQVRERGAMV